MKKPPPEYNRPLTITDVLADQIHPTKPEYSQLKELDARMHSLKFSQDIAKKYSNMRKPDGAPMSLNRYAVIESPPPSFEK